MASVCFPRTGFSIPHFTEGDFVQPFPAVSADRPEATGTSPQETPAWQDGELGVPFENGEVLSYLAGTLPPDRLEELERQLATHPDSARRLRRVREEFAAMFPAELQKEMNRTLLGSLQERLVRECS